MSNKLTVDDMFDTLTIGSSMSADDTGTYTIENKEDAITVLSQLVNEIIGRDAYIDYSTPEMYGPTQIAELEAINGEKDLQRKIAIASGFTIGASNE